MIVLWHALGSLLGAENWAQVSGFLRPKSWLNAKLENGLNDATDIVTKNLTKSLIHLRGLSLTSQTISELRLNHAECRFNIAPLVVLSEKPFLIVGIVVKHAFPQNAFLLPPVSFVLCLSFRQSVLGCAIHLEGNVRHSVMVDDGLKIRRGQISLVCRNFLHREVTSGCLDKRLEIRTVTRKAITDFNRRHDVRFHAAHQMHFHPVAFGHQAFIFVLRVNPLVKAAGRKAGRVNREIGLDSLKRQTASFNQSSQQRRQARVFQVAGDRVVVSGTAEQPFALRVSQVSHKAPSRNRRVDLKRTRKKDVSEWQSRTAYALHWFFNAFTQFSKQLDKPFLLVGLRFVVGRPFLLVGLSYSDCLGNGFHFSVVRVLTLNRELYGPNMLALNLPCFVIRTRTGRIRDVRLNDIRTTVCANVARLRRNKPSITALSQLRFGRYFKTFLLSGFHCESPLGKTQPEAYNGSCLGHIASTVWLNVPVGVAHALGLQDWRRRRDSNSRNLAARRFLRPFQSTALARLR